MIYKFIGYGYNSGTFKDKSGKDVVYNTCVLVVQGETDDTKTVKTFKTASGFKPGHLSPDTKVNIAFNEFGRVTAVQGY